MNLRECHNELDWTAFCYLADELSAADVERFESRLAEEQPAREALARAVELSQLTAAAESQSDELVAPAVRPTSDWGRRLAWMAIGGLAVALGGLFLSGILGPAGPVAVNQRQSEAQLALAAAWTEARAEFADQRAAGLWPSGLIASDADPELLALADQPGDEAVASDAPSWMTAAVLGLAGQLPDDANGPLSPDRLEN